VNAGDQRRTRKEQRRASEEALLEAAAAVVAERGIDRASLADIGRRAGMSRGLPTHHFGSKRALIERLAARAQQRLAEGARDALSLPEAGDLTGLDRLRTTIQTYFDLFEQPTAELRAFVAMWGAMIPTEASVEGMLEADRRGIGGWVAQVRRGQADGSIRDDLDPDAIGALVLALTRGLVAVHLIDTDLVDQRQLREICDICITGALAPPLKP
jgi:AcrR family transcriptional regulator